MSEQTAQIEAGAYELIVKRLGDQARDLQGRLAALDENRKKIFGTVTTELLATVHAGTAHAAIPRDLAGLGSGIYLIGLQVQFGLKSNIELGDLFSSCRIDENLALHPEPVEEILADPTFHEDFRVLMQYYREAVLLRFMRIGPALHLVMQVGRSSGDIKSFKWLLQQDRPPKYLGNRSDHECKPPPSHEFSWRKTNRDMQRHGTHPHLSIEDRLFVETVGGDLTIKIENNTESGKGIHAEPVDDADQTLDDADFQYAIIGNVILLRILPYREDTPRYFAYNESTREVHRLDGIGVSCVLLPDDQGIVFSNGYLLATGTLKTFEFQMRLPRFESKVASANGEDTQYIFRDEESGNYVLYTYNMIQRGMETPLITRGYALDHNGRLVCLHGPPSSQRHHALQIWRTPFYQDQLPETAAADRGSFLYKIGNPQLVAAMAEIHELLAILSSSGRPESLYLDLISRARGVLDRYFWLADDQAAALAAPLHSIIDTAEAAIGEYDKVREIRAATGATMELLEADARSLLNQTATSSGKGIETMVQGLTELRGLRGRVETARQLRYHDEELLDHLAESISNAETNLAADAMDFLAGEDSLVAYREVTEQVRSELGDLKTTLVLDAADQRVAAAAAELELLIEVMGSLPMTDPQRTTAVTDRISRRFADLNGVQAQLRAKRQELAREEASAEFASRMNLLAQTTTHSLNLADTPEKCDEFLTRITVQIEELESAFAEFDDSILAIQERREAIYEAFQTRRQGLLDQRTKRAEILATSANRILAGMQTKLRTLRDEPAVRGFFAADVMVAKLRDIIRSLQEAGSTVRSEEISTRLVALQGETLRQLQDQNELFSEDGSLVRLGEHSFSVNHQELELSIVEHSGELCYHLSGTGYYEAVAADLPEVEPELWTQDLVSENSQVYRAEWLAYQMLNELDDKCSEIPSLDGVHSYAAPRYAEGYVRGIHDEDAHRLLEHLVPLHHALGPLRKPAEERAMAMWLWQNLLEDRQGAEISGLLEIHRHLESHRSGESSASARPLHELLAIKAADFLGKAGAGNSIERVLARALTRPDDAALAARLASILYQQLGTDARFVGTGQAHGAIQVFREQLQRDHLVTEFREALAGVSGDPNRTFLVLLDWVETLVSKSDPEISKPWLIEAAAHLLVGTPDDGTWIERDPHFEIHGMRGQHSVVKNGGDYRGDYHEFRRRLDHFASEVVPAFTRFSEFKKRALIAKRQQLRLEEFKPRVMADFVRSRLINEVYLRFIGTNFAKQLGAAGAAKQADRSGLLLLVSPPGYGKTTLMEYVANRLGLVFMKINGPAIGHQVTSLDPMAADNLAARQEIDKLNLALEMGDNVMIYLDDIQHTHPELLQRFISLCDSQRKMEGVWNGRPRTYDLRGKRVAVVMAGNPYTEGGGKFRIPDMLANRADTYNLGDIIGGHSAAFESSFIENALTSNPVTARLASAGGIDVAKVIAAAESSIADPPELDLRVSPAELQELLAVVRHLVRARETLLRVNAEYIRSAAQDDRFRTEPAFRLQGSYRNMNRIAARISPMMNPQEIKSLLDDHYQHEAQTLTHNAEANLLKLQELENSMTAEGQARWNQIKKEFMRQHLLGGAGENDPVARVVSQLSGFNENLGSIRELLGEAREATGDPTELAPATLARLEAMLAALRAVPVEVEIRVVPVQQENSPIEEISLSPDPVRIVPSVRQLTPDQTESAPEEQGGGAGTSNHGSESA